VEAHTKIRMLEVHEYINVENLGAWRTWERVLTRGSPGACESCLAPRSLLHLGKLEIETILDCLDSSENRMLHPYLTAMFKS
jgi:hypothetical protein